MVLEHGGMKYSDLIGICVLRYLRYLSEGKGKIIGKAIGKLWFVMVENGVFSK